MPNLFNTQRTCAFLLNEKIKKALFIIIELILSHGAVLFTLFSIKPVEYTNEIRKKNACSDFVCSFPINYHIGPFHIYSD